MEKFQQFLRLIDYYAPLDNEEIEFLREEIPVRTYLKNEFLLQEGQVCRTIFFVLKGCVRLFYNVNGVDKTAFFYTEGRFICAGESYTFGTPARENLQAVEEVELMFFEKDLLDKLLRRSSKFEVMARIATEDELLAYQRMIASFVTKNAEERYVELIANQGDLFLRVPQQYIASYLGISPETLSRIKRRILEKTKVRS